jgi:large repetitive protein
LTVRWIPAILLLGACSSSWTAKDGDGDGFTSLDGDCWDSAPGPAGSGLAGTDIHPGAEESWYDGIDADCAGDDDFDADGDGFVPSGEGGRATFGVPSSGDLPDGDCWDDPTAGPSAPLNGFDSLEAADVNPSVSDVWYDGVDQNCDDADDFDQDGDGFASAWYAGHDGLSGDDCFDAPGDAFVNDAGLAPASVSPDATEIWYDGTDQDCDGNEFDQDEDGYVRDEECDDEDPTVFPNDEVEVWYNCVDENCDGNDGDKDGDGYLSDALAYAATCDVQSTNPGREAGDCWDDPATTPTAMVALEPFPQPTADGTHPLAVDAFYDAVDQNCDEQSDFDQDQDGEDSLYFEARTGGVGPDCFDAASDVADFEFENGGGFEPPDVNTTSAETWYDGTDQDCDGNEYDQDGDDHDWDEFGGLDCDDQDAAISPDAVETVGDEIDADCDEEETCFDDDDGDGSLDSSGDTRASADVDCSDANEGSLATPTTDCDDTRNFVHVGAFETIDDGRDEDCDGGETCYDDADDDGYLDAAAGLRASLDLDCTDAHEGRATDPATDCDDRSQGDHPGASEIVANGDDEDCDGDEVCYVDADDDGFRPDTSATVVSADLTCTGPGESEPADPSGDCDDDDATIWPGATDDDSRLGVDDDCDGYIDEGSVAYGDVIFTELAIRVSGSGAGEWFELYNQSGRDLWLDGWEMIQGADRFCISPDLGVWPAETYLVFCATAPTGVTCDYTFNTNTLAGFDDCAADDAPADINLSEPGDSLTLDLDGSTIDDVAWDAGWTLTNNVSLMLQTKHYDPDDNDDPAHWCDGVEAYTSGRLGSPGLESDCP